MLVENRFERFVMLLLPIFYLMGFVFHLIDATYPLMLSMTPYTILATAVIGFLPDFKAHNNRLLVWAAITFLCTLILEILGVATGMIFGAYTYGQTLGFSLLEVPLLIGINWTLIIMGALSMVKRLTSHASLIALGTATITVVFDWIMEPVAIALDYWSWSGGKIPLQNYIAWFLIAYAFTRIFEAMRLKTTSFIPSLIVVVQAIFFLLLRLFVVV
jgi:putative membrane protein